VAPVTGETPTKVFQLAQNHPNPFNPLTNIRFTVEKSGPLELAVYDVSGRKIRTLVRGITEAGDHLVTWDGTDRSGGRVPSGTYFYKLRSGTAVETRKMTLLK
jgi:flagellar hook assembly protein FlgD